MTNREEKLHQLKLAVRRVETGRTRHAAKGTKLNFQSVAAEAGLSASTIHTRYPEIAELIRQKAGKAMRVQRDRKQDELKKCKALNRSRRVEIAELKSDLANVASRYASAMIRLKQLEAGTSPLPGST